MTALSEILVPGERVVTRYLPMGLIWTGLAVLGSLLLVLNATVWYRTGFGDHEIEWLLYFDGGVALYLVITVLTLGRWKLAVTDQRLLIREGSGFQEIQRDLIREVRYAGLTLTVRATDREVGTSILIPFARRIVGALERNDRGEALA